MGRKKRRSKINYIYQGPKIEYIYNTDFKLEIKKSNIKDAGLGVFSKEFIQKNTLLGEYIGEKKHQNDFSYGLYCLQLKSEYSIDAFNYPRTIFAMINDSRFSDFTYNCKFITYENKAEVWAIRDININDELYLNYGDGYWKYR